MSLQPRIESRVSALERRQSTIEARTEEINDDVVASIKQLSEDVTKSFNSLADYQIKIEATMATKEDVAALKENMATMETRILDAFKQLLTTITPQNEN